MWVFVIVNTVYMMASFSVASRAVDRLSGVLWTRSAATHVWRPWNWIREIGSCRCSCFAAGGSSGSRAVERLDRAWVAVTSPYCGSKECQGTTDLGLREGFEVLNRRLLWLLWHRARNRCHLWHAPALHGLHGANKVWLNHICSRTDKSYACWCAHGHHGQFWKSCKMQNGRPSAHTVPGETVCDKLVFI